MYLWRIYIYNMDDQNIYSRRNEATIDIDAEEHSNESPYNSGPERDVFSGVTFPLTEAQSSIENIPSSRSTTRSPPAVEDCPDLIDESIVELGIDTALNSTDTIEQLFKIVMMMVLETRGEPRYDHIEPMRTMTENDCQVLNGGDNEHKNLELDYEFFAQGRQINFYTLAAWTKWELSPITEIKLRKLMEEEVEDAPDFSSRFTLEVFSPIYTIVRSYLKYTNNASKQLSVTRTPYSTLGYYIFRCKEQKPELLELDTDVMILATIADIGLGMNRAFLVDKGCSSYPNVDVKTSEKHFSRLFTDVLSCCRLHGITRFIITDSKYTGLFELNTTSRFSYCILSHVEDDSVTLRTAILVFLIPILLQKKGGERKKS